MADAVRGGGVVHCGGGHRVAGCPYLSVPPSTNYDAYVAGSFYMGKGRPNCGENGGGARWR